MRIVHISRLVTSVALPLAMFPLIFWAQLTLGHDVALFPLYIIPVAKLSWDFGWKGAAIAVFCATCLWFLASFTSQQPYKYEWLRWYNAGIRGFVFLMAAIFPLLFKRVVEQHRRRMEAMRALLNVCHGCGALQGSNGRWIPLEELNPKPTQQSCECPKCATAAKIDSPTSA